MDHPNQLEWIEGELPDIHSVPYDCRVLAWFVHDITQEEYERCRTIHGYYPSPEDNGKIRRIVMCLPYKNDLNPLRWCDSSCHPVGYHERVAHWTWLRKGTPSEKVDFKKEGF